MSKINATFSSGYYIAPDVDFRKLEEQQRLEQRGKRKHAGANAADGDGDDNVKRQTFAIPFDLICLHCNRRIARGSHVYTNRRATEQRYLDSIRVWELEILCRFCKGKYYLRTDPETPKETGGYICEKGCRRVEGDFFSLNQQNQATREEWAKAKAEAEMNPLAAMEKENAAARALEERNRQIEEEVEQQAEYNDAELLQMLRHRPRRTAEGQADAYAGGDGSDDDDSANEKGQRTTLPVPAMPSLPNPFKNESADGPGDRGRDAEDNSDSQEDLDERSYLEFAKDTELRWRALERQQRAQQRQREALANAAEGSSAHVEEDEVHRVLARYGGGARVATADKTTAAPQSLTLTEADRRESTTASSTPPPFTITPATSGFVPSPSLHRNKFFAADDEVEVDDDDDDEIVLPLSRPLARTASTVTLRPLSGTAASVGAVSAPLPRAAGNALLRHLVDDDSDEA